MKISTQIDTAFIAVTVFLLAGVGTAAADCYPIDETIGIAPVVDAPGPNAMPVLLGTALKLSWQDVDDVGASAPFRFLVQASTVTTVGMTEQTRVIEVVVSYRSVVGEAAVSTADFRMIDADLGVFEAVAPPVVGVTPPLTEWTITPADGIITGAIYFEVPLRTTALTIAFDPAPSDLIAGQWTLSAP